MTIEATDSSQIVARAIAAAVAAAIGGDVGVAVAIGLTIAFNEVDVDVDAHAFESTLTTTSDGSGDIVIKAITSGALRFDLTGNALITAGNLDDATEAADDDPNNNSDPVQTGQDESVEDAREDAEVLAALEAAVHARFPLRSGKWNTDDTLQPLYTSASGTQDLERGDTVLHGGTIYVFVPTAAADVDLGAETYAANPTRWLTGFRVALSDGDVVRDAATGHSYRYVDPDTTSEVDLVDLGAVNFGSALWEYDVPELKSIKPGEIWQFVAGSDVFLITKVVTGSVTTFQVSRPTIDTVAVAASLAFALGGGVGVAVAGAGAYARNDVTGSTIAYAETSVLRGPGSVEVTATAAAEIVATVVAAAVAVGIGLGAAGVGASIGISISDNRIGARAEDGTRQPFEVRASLVDTAADAGGHLWVRARSSEIISAVVVAASVAVGAASSVGAALSGAGASATNTIIADITATIDGNGPTTAAITGIIADTVEVTATDASRISAVGVGASVAAGFGGVAGLALSIAISIGRNEIDNRVNASIVDVSDGVTTRAAAPTDPEGTGDALVSATSDSTITAIAVAASVAVTGAGTVAVSVSGAGAAATNVILSQTHASITGSTVTTATGNVVVTATDRSRIRAVIVAASAAVAIGFVGVGASIGVSLATNLIGWKSADEEQPSEVHAYVMSSTIEAGGELTVTAQSDAEIEALVLAISVAIAGGAAGLAVTGAGSNADNRISTDVHAYVQEGDVTADALRIMALDMSRIRAAVAAASVGVAGGAGVGISVSIAVSLASNRVANDVAAYLRAINLDKVREVVIIASSGLDPPPVANSDLDLKLEAAIITSGDDNDSSTDEVEVIDPAAVAALKVALPTLDLSDRLAVTQLVEGTEWILRDLTSGIGYRIVKTVDGKYEISRITIDAVAVAASASVGIGGVGGGAGSGAGALAVNTVVSRTNAFIVDSDVTTAGDITISAASTSSIIATIVSISVAVGGGAFGGAALSIGVAIARNQIGVEPGSFDNDDDAVPPSHRISESDPLAATPDTPVLVQISTGETVLIDGGPNFGKVYQYVGTATVMLDLLDTRYDDTRLWREITTERPVEVKAYVLDSTIHATGDLEITASSRQSIASIVIAGSAAVSGSGGVGVSGAGAGASSVNRIATQVAAFIEGDLNGGGVTAKTITVRATDVSSIKADVGAASLAGSIGLGAGISVSIAIALADNSIANSVEAFALDATLTATAGAITIDASENATIRAVTFAASVSIGGGFVGVAVSGAGAAADNRVANRVRAYATNSSLTANTVAAAVGDVEITATDTAVITATIVAVSLAAAGGAVAVGVSIGVAIARNRIGLDYDYSSDEFIDPFSDTGTDAGTLVFGGDLVRVAPHPHRRPGDTWRDLPLPRSVQLLRQPLRLGAAVESELQRHHTLEARPAGLGCGRGGHAEQLERRRRRRAAVDRVGRAADHRGDRRSVRGGRRWHRRRGRQWCGILGHQRVGSGRQGGHLRRRCRRRVRHLDRDQRYQHLLDHRGDRRCVDRRGDRTDRCVGRSRGRDLAQRDPQRRRRRDHRRCRSHRARHRRIDHSERRVDLPEDHERSRSAEPGGRRDLGPPAGHRRHRDGRRRRRGDVDGVRSRDGVRGLGTAVRQALRPHDPGRFALAADHRGRSGVLDREGREQPVGAPRVDQRLHAGGGGVGEHGCALVVGRLLDQPLLHRHPGDDRRHRWQRRSDWQDRRRGVRFGERDGVPALGVGVDRCDRGGGVGLGDPQRHPERRGRLARCRHAEAAATGRVAAAVRPSRPPRPCWSTLPRWSWRSPPAWAARSACRTPARTSAARRRHAPARRRSSVRQPACGSKRRRRSTPAPS